MWNICESGSPSRASSSRRLSRRVSDSPFSYAIYRLLPPVERGERDKVGIVAFSRPLGFVGVRTGPDRDRAHMLWPNLDLDAVQPHLDALERVAAAADDA